MDTISEEWTTWTKPGDHTKQAELAGVKDCSRRKAASKEIHCGCWSFGVESHEALQGDLVVVVKDLQLLIVKDEGCEATEEHRYAIKLVHPQTGGRIAMVATGKSGRENSMQGSCVGADASQNCRHGASCGGPEQAHMLCF